MTRSEKNLSKFNLIRLFLKTRLICQAILNFLSLPFDLRNVETFLCPTNSKIFPKIGMVKIFSLEYKHLFGVTSLLSKNDDRSPFNFQFSIATKFFFLLFCLHGYFFVSYIVYVFFRWLIDYTKSRIRTVNIVPD